MFSHIATPNHFHTERVLTMVPGLGGIYVVLGLFGDHETGALNELIRTIARVF